ncbi:MAG: TonB family protein [Alphaproteobacteria bacterium]|nr:TonB family protein [Alphaproteobacteria bacterium]
MTQSLGTRATSIGASAVLLGLAVFAAFSATISYQTEEGDLPFTIPVFTLPPDPPPPVARPRTPPPERPLLPQQPDDITFRLTPPVVDAPPTSSYFSPPEVGLAQITNPRWLRQPRDLEIYYPSRALARDIPGQVVLDCMVDVAGALNCSVVSETPVNWGFGQAALRISRDYRMVPAMREGQAVEGRYRMRVPFEVR